MREPPLLVTLTKNELRAMRSDLPPPSPDDVSLTFDGRRLDSNDAVSDGYERFARRHVPNPFT